MVRAILEGRKTQTRRVIKPQPPDIPGLFYEQAEPGVWRGYLSAAFREPANVSPLALFGTYGGQLYCPYAVGDRLWVREPFYVQPDLWKQCHGPQPIHYAADVAHRAEAGDYTCKPSIHMPRWASRITLEIVAIRVERVQDISEANAYAEGITEEEAAAHWCDGPLPEAAFADLWDRINAKRGYPWKSNPWVWVVEFRRTA
jgi:hypothetical protein